MIKERDYKIRETEINFGESLKYFFNKKHLARIVSRVEFNILSDVIDFILIPQGSKVKIRIVSSLDYNYPRLSYYSDK